ncbi:hypothetical protein O0I10_006666 [Lichtheimia ornata]|uniref:F-box domain-containing protein n=1 Tax=Lichtheimia ornata TaxID=688661 RepID=A0AAD7V3T0_9FUNG|nr:uncharacterized protein O0I10_006666 [Lichtheimia ornata]KAJ8657602.1 hypothetical protein O0I10_006666 [Lichtheimia ornata]
MTHSIWNDLCKQPVITASTHKYTKLVNDATTQLPQPIDSIMTTLNERAMGLTKCANFNAALRDAQVMQQLSPSSALGYLREAAIYNEQGKRRQAVDICLKGLNVVDTNDPHYAMLQRIKDDSEHHGSKRIDFIKQLPVDIVTTIIVPLLVDDSPLPSLIPCPYLHVSNLWRDCILQCRKGLRFETGYHEEEKDMEKCSQLIRFCQHIKALHVPRYSKGRWLQRLLRDNDFRSLHELYIHNFYSVYIDDFVPLLESINSTLTHLTIHGARHNLLCLTEILTACPNLVSLTLSQNDNDDLSHLPMTTWPNMETLSIECSDADVTEDEIIRLCKCFPSLKMFHLYPCYDIKSALVVPQYCPLLKSVDLEIYMVYVAVMYTNESSGYEEMSMRKLSVNIDDWDEDDDLQVDIGTIIRQHHTTLEDIEWHIHPERDYEDLYHLQYPQLKKLELSSSGSWILRNAPILEELRMSSRAINNDPAMLNTIPPRSKKLELELDDGIEIEDKDDIVRYLHRVSDQCALHEFAIHVNNPSTFRNVLDATCRLNTLQRLMMGVRGNWDLYQMERSFDSLVNGCPYLSCLEIDCMNAPSTYSLDTLKRLERLKQFAFCIMDTNGYDSLWHSIRTFSQLQCIQIHPANAVNKSVIRDLKEQRRDMKVIVDEIFKRF